MRLRERLVDSPESLGVRRRAQRLNWFQTVFPALESMSVIDLGGRPEFWMRASTRPGSVHVVNLEPPDSGLPTWIRADQANACDLPPHIAGGHYDLVFSNSVLEHVGGHAQRLRFAEAVHSLSPRHWVQTPYRYFPVEPHWLFPGFQFLPLLARGEISRRWPLVHTQSESRAAGIRAAMGVELLSRTEMKAYFPDSDVEAERMLGLAKSLVAIRAT
jgi:hypothetical protein